MRRRHDTSEVGESSSQTWSTRAADVAALADQFASQVDAEARFPFEAVGALRERGLLGCAVSERATLRDVARITTTLSESCGSTGAVFAMHQSQVFTVMAHGRGDSFDSVIDSIGNDRVLIASCLTEKTTGGDPGRSTCSLEPGADGYRLEKASPAISYGAHADGIMVSARRSPTAEPHDQVLVFCPAADTEVTPTSEWDAIGMRGTGSGGFTLSAEIAPSLVFPDPFATIGSQTMIPASHALWAACWLGLGREAVRRTLGYLRRSNDRGTPLETVRDAKLVQARRLLGSMAQDVEVGCARVGVFEPGLMFERTAFFNDLKVRTSESLLQVIGLCMQIVGIAAYTNHGEFSLSRLLRDAHSAPLMVSNQRIDLNNARAARAPLGAP